MLTRPWAVLLLFAVTLSARGQLRLPAVPLPTVPLQTLPLQSAQQTLDQVDAQTRDRLSNARHLQINLLIRANRRVVEADPDGEPIVRGEILALSPSDAALSHALSAGFLVAREQPLSSAELRVIVLTAPAGMSTKRALRNLREFDPDGLYDYNHIYTHAGGAAEVLGSLEDPATAPISAAGRGPSERPRIRVGLLDTGVDSSHPVFHDSTVHTWGCANKPNPSPHGTAVASLLLTRASAELYAADVYCGLPTGGAVDAIIGALAWMMSEHVPVINVSLVGPKNAMLEQTVAALIVRGYVIVAAVGNDGPTAPPLYPAAYARVVGVTGVDVNQRVLLEALRGPQVMFAAAGAGIKAADVAHAYADVRGTSFAAPTVAGLLAELMTTPDRATADAAVDTLAKRAIDLGPPGKDFTYGFGLVGTDAH
ncbi:MAG TPA: S8 family serine peptidase [Steroidobacteraceae bacterium]|nr:S8 family serine peptidase [Steroidobacteraceae bacterium]